MEDVKLHLECAQVFARRLAQEQPGRASILANLDEAKTAVYSLKANVDRVYKNNIALRQQVANLRAMLHKEVREFMK
jgi:hypothetical protein